MNLLVFDFPGVAGQHYDQLCRGLNHGTPLRTLAELGRAGYPVAHPMNRSPQFPSDLRRRARQSLVDFVLRLPAEPATARPIHPLRSSTGAPAHDRSVGRGFHVAPARWQSTEGLQRTSRLSSDGTERRSVRSDVATGCAVTTRGWGSKQWRAGYRPR